MEKQKNIPALRFPEFSGEWEKNTLNSISTWASGGTPPKDNPLYWNGNIPWISASSMRGIEYSDSEIKITNEGLLNGSKLAVKGSLLILVRGSMLFNKIPIGIALKDVAFNQDVKSINIDSGHNTIFVLYWFISNENLVLNMVTGTGIGAGKLDLADLKSLPISLPSLPEQTKIATFLTAVDERLNQLKQKKTLLEQYKNGVMQQIFNQEIRFKDDDGNEFPEWEVKKLGEIGEFKNGINKSSEDFGFGFPFINLMDVFGKSTISNLKLDLVNANEKELKLYELKKGDVLFIRSSVKKSGVGETSLVLEDLTNTVFSGFLIRFRDTLIELDLNFKKYCFAAKKFRENLISLSTTSANTNINQESLNELEISLPSIAEQTKIANFLTAIDEKINTCSNQITKTEQYKKGLLQQLFV